MSVSAALQLCLGLCVGCVIGFRQRFLLPFGSVFRSKPTPRPDCFLGDCPVVLVSRHVVCHHDCHLVVCAFDAGLALAQVARTPRPNPRPGRSIWLSTVAHDSCWLGCQKRHTSDVSVEPHVRRNEAEVAQGENAGGVETMWKAAKAPATVELGCGSGSTLRAQAFPDQKGQEACSLRAEPRRLSSCGSEDVRERVAARETLSARARRFVIAEHMRSLGGTGVNSLTFQTRCSMI